MRRNFERHRNLARSERLLRWRQRGNLVLVDQVGPQLERRDTMGIVTDQPRPVKPTMPAPSPRSLPRSLHPLVLVFADPVTNLARAGAAVFAGRPFT